MGAKRQHYQWETLTKEGVKSCLKLPRTLKAAQETKSEHYYTGVPCVNGHTVVRRTSNCACPMCCMLRSRGLPMASKVPVYSHVFNMKINLNNRKLGFRNVESLEIEE